MAAACLVIAGVFIGRIEKPEMIAEVYAPEYVEYMAANGDIKEVFLADGTHVYLDSQFLPMLHIVDHNVYSGSIIIQI